MPAATERVDVVQLKAVYYDTPERHLQRRAITLRRRSGGDDAGWHLKLPADLSRLEIELPARSMRVPRELSDLLMGVRLEQPLAPTATLETTRVRHQIESAAGGVIAEVDEDDVRAVVAGDPGRESSWREIEIELGPAGDEDALESLASLIKGKRIRPADYASKYARAVGPPPVQMRP